MQGVNGNPFVCCNSVIDICRTLRSYVELRDVPPVLYSITSWRSMASILKIRKEQLVPESTHFSLSEFLTYNWVLPGQEE